MRAYIVWLPDRAGTLADLSEELGSQGINIIGVAATTWEDRGAVALITDLPDETQALLDQRSADYHAVELVEANLDDEPGMLGRAARRLADRGINIQAVVPMGVSGGQRVVGFVVDIPAAARDALGDLAASA